VAENREALSRYGYPEQSWLQSIARYHDGVQRDHAAARGRTRWAAAAPEDDVNSVDRLYPCCQILHVTGDPAVQRRLARSSSARTRRSRAAGERMLPGRYCEVPHAELQAEPEQTMRTVLAFLGEDWDPTVVAATS
jgi:hypothetical protein